jgi:hypothetical protein
VSLNRLVSYAREYGWLPEGSELLGIFEGVAFSVDEAAMALGVVNSGTEYQLRRDVGLDVRAVESLVLARPITSLPHLAQVPNVGPSALMSLRDYVVRYLQNDQNDGSFVLTPDLADYYTDVMSTVLRDDREYFEELLSVAASLDEAERLLHWIEVELAQAIRSRVGKVFPSEQDLLEELYVVLEELQLRSLELLLN